MSGKKFIVSILILSGIAALICFFYFNSFDKRMQKITENFKTYVLDDSSQSVNSIHVQYIKKDDYLMMSAKKGWQCRISNTMSMFINAFNLVRDQIDTDFTLDIETDDFCNISYRLAYAYRDVEGDYGIPDFAFVNWPEVGIKDYDITCKEIEEAGKKPYIYNKLFWIGNASTNEIRGKLVQKGKNNDNYEFIAMNWQPQELVKDKLEIHPADRYVSLPDHAQYKYLIDVIGIGYSSRVKMLMFTGRPLFYVKRNVEEYYFKDLKPFVHYIPVEADLSDLDEKYKWAEEHPEEAQKIAQNALDYAKTHLTLKAATLDFAQTILKYVEDQKAQQQKPKFLPY